ncbi:MAG: DUF2304 domain-containing protein [Bacteroidota bacterium]
MEIRIFQIVVPAIALLFIISFIMRYRKSRATITETLLSIFFWIAVAVFAIIPDLISNFIADLLGIKSNVNAIIFLCLGLLFFIQFKMYGLVKRQEETITRLTRQLALRESEQQLL